MKQIFVYVFFILIPPVGSALAPDSSTSSKSGSFVLEAKVTDLYGWSEDLSKYSLKESRFSFKMWDMGLPNSKSGEDKTARAVSPGDLEQGGKTARVLQVAPGNLPTASLVDEGRVTQKAGSSSARYLSVSHNKVSIESASGGKVSVNSRLSKNKDTLDIYLSEDSKKKIWVRLLKVAGVSPVFSEDGHLNYSDYNCKLNKAQQLVCSIKYLSRGL